MIKRHILKISFAVLFLTALDLFSKWFFTGKTYFNDFIINIQYNQNFGSAFNLFSNLNYYQYFIIFISIIVLIILILKIKFFLDNKFFLYSYIFIFSGILGNTIDRLFFGYVRDFISLKYLFIFNLADFYLTIGFILLLYIEFINNKK